MIQKSLPKFITVLFTVILIGFLLSSCYPSAVSRPSQPQSTTGVKKATANVTIQASGLTIEQENISRRLELENIPGSIKHLYIIAPMTGDVLLYSTVQGKITSSGKRLSPYHAYRIGTHYESAFQKGFPVKFGESGSYYTEEVLQDDGTYGSSSPYIFWFSSRGHYHQHFITGGQIIHLSDAPMSFPKVIVNIEELEKNLPPGPHEAVVHPESTPEG